MTLTLILITIIVTILWLTAVSNFIFFPRLKVQAPLKKPLISILIPARNEADHISRTIKAVLAQTYSRFELIILDDQSEDETAAQVNSFAQNDKRVTLIHGRSLPPGWLGKNWACHQLAQQAAGDCLLFLDADVQLGSGALNALIAMQASTQADLLTVWPTQKTCSWAERLVVPQISLAVLAYLPVLLVHYSRLSIFAAANGQCLLFEPKAYAKIGGHTAVKDQIIEDVALARQIKAAHLKLRMADGHDLIRCRMYTNWAEVKAGFAKNILAGHGKSVLFLMFSTLFHWLVFVGPLFIFIVTWQSWPLLLFLAVLALRAATAWFSGQRLLDAFFQPLSVGLLSLIAWQSTLWHYQGKGVWKGRRLESQG